MKTKRFWKFALLLLVPLALYFYIAERNSWRPKKIELGIFPRSLLFSPDSRTLVVEDASDEFRDDLVLCDVASASRKGSIEKAESECFLEKGTYLAAFCSSERFEPKEQRVKIFSVKDAKEVASGPQNFLPVGVLADDSTLIGLISTKGTGALYRWNWRTDSTPQLYLRFPKVPENTPWLLPDKVTLSDGNHFWDLSTGKQRFQIWRDGEVVISSSHSLHIPSASHLAFLEGDEKSNTVRIWNYKTGKLESSMPYGQASYGLSGLQLSPDNSTMAVANGDAGRIELISIPNGQVLRQLQVPKSDRYRLQFSPDGRTLASVSDEGDVLLCRVK